MLASIAQYLNNIGSGTDRRVLQSILAGIGGTMATQSIRTAGLVTNAANTARIGAAAYYACVRGKLVTIAANLDMPALVGSVSNATFNAYVFYVNANSVVTTRMGTAGATLAGVTFPDTPPDLAIVGFIIINPTGAGPFVGGSTALADVTVVPNVVFISPTGSFDPTILYG